MWSPIDIIPLLTAFILSAAATRASIALSNRLNLRAVPDHRSSHTTPTPQLGGLGPAISLFLLLMFFTATLTDAANGTRINIGLGLILLGTLAAFAVGLRDDLRPLSPRVKLAGQIIAALFSIEVARVLALGWQDSPGWLWLGFELALIAFWLLWCVGFINAYNFMDGMNGKAGLFAVNAFAFTVLILINGRESGSEMSLWAKRADLDPDTAITLSGVAIASILGFLWFNCRTKALTFLGDCGSHLIGYLIAAVTFLTAASLWGPGPSMLAYTIVLMPFIYDVTFTLIKRVRERKSFWKAHREHLYQRLMIAGYGHMAVLRVCAVTYVACGLLGLVCARSETLAARLLCLALSLLAMAMYTAFVLHRERSTTPAAVHE